MNYPTEHKNPRKKLRLIALGILGLIILLAILPKCHQKIEKSEETAAAVVTQIVKPSTAEDVIYLPATVRARFDARLATDKPGIVAKILVDKGSPAEAGQVLLRIEDSAWKTRAEQAEIEEREAKKEYNRWLELQKTGAVSPSDFDTVKARYDTAVLSLADARIQHDKCSLKSPVRGIITDRYLEVGEHAPEGAAAFRLVDIDEVKLSVDIPERNVLAVVPGNRMTFTVDVLPDRVFTGTVSFVSSAASEENNSFAAELRCANPDRELRPGMIATIALSRAVREDAIVVPLSSVIPRKGEYIAFVVENDRASRRVVKLQSITEKDVILSSGLNPGDELVVDGGRTLADGMKVSRGGTGAGQ